MDIEANGQKFKSLTKINVLLGKNGTGKSSLLRNFEGRVSLRSRAISGRISLGVNQFAL